jgi:hypothetical protein
MVIVSIESLASAKMKKIIPVFDVSQSSFLPHTVEEMKKGALPGEHRLFPVCPVWRRGGLHGGNTKDNPYR